MSNSPSGPGVVIAVKPDGNQLQNSSIDSKEAISLIEQSWKNSDPRGKALETRVFFGPDSLAVAAVGTGSINNSLTDHEKAERTRKITATGAKALKEQISNQREVLVDQVWSSHSAAVGATLGTFNYSVKTKKDAIEKRKPIVYKPLQNKVVQLDFERGSGKLISLDWSSGLIFGQAQNLARELMETGANLMTPTIFCERIKKEFDGIHNVEIHVRDKAWAEGKGMNSFLSVARGTEEPCKFLEIHYKGTNSNGSFKPSVAFVGKGITFDSGGISLKPGAGMKLMRADMGGAATVTSAAWAIAKLQIPIDLLVCTPLTENMPSGHATKPGDIIYAMNGKSIEVDNTDAEGRLVLADALYYASSVYRPNTVIDVATLTGAMMIALGEAFSGVFSTSDELWSHLDAAGKAEHDRFWRMPFDDCYMRQIDTSNADLCNTGGRLAGSCTAAIFLREFVDGLACNASTTEESGKAADKVAYAHIDIAGAMDCTMPDSYNVKGLTGRPVRSLVEYVRQQAALSK
ncbi:cytosol aminopeptidase family, catalytic domain-containing protein [Phakopsora pachyrhizi]|nr:cytosol aminopeptidase family, catalytic domain-containing protein [Phakopsora pachyrhizi]